MHLAYAAIEASLRVLLVDMDKQGSLSLTFPSAANAMPGLAASSLYNAEQSEDGPEAVSETLSIIRADNGLLSIDKAENQVIWRPGAALRRFADDFHICVIDNPAMLGVRLMASLAASDSADPGI